MRTGYDVDPLNRSREYVVAYTREHYLASMRHSDVKANARPSGQVLEGVRLPDHGRKPLLDSVIAISKDFKPSVNQEESIEGCRFKMHLLSASKVVRF